MLAAEPKPVKEQTQIVFPKQKKEEMYVLTGRTVLLELTINAILAAFFTFISLYSMIEPPSSQGTFAPKEFTNILVFFCLYHFLAFRKLFYPPYRVSIYKILVLVAQIIIFYVGIIVIS